MNEEATSYDRVPYRCTVHTVTAPHYLAVVSRVHGGPEPRSSAYRMLELGCGDGTNLLSLAFFNPACSFVGVDASRVQIEMGRRAIAELGLENLTLEVGDVRALPASCDGEFDYIVSHGVFSWVPEDARAGILRSARARLAQNGLLYVSYNVLPGWKMRGVVRDLAMQAAGDIADGRERVAAARKAATELRDLLDVEHPYRAILKKELGSVIDSELSYVLHEYLSEENVAFYFSDFVALAARAGFAHVGDALIRSVENSLPREARERLGKEAAGVEGHRLSDLIHNRPFRATVLCRDDARVTAPESAHELLRSLSVAARLTSADLELDLEDGVEISFSSPSGSVVTAKDPLLKACISLLADRYPDSIAFDGLVTEATELLRARKPNTEVRPEQIDKLVRGLLLLYQNEQGELRVAHPELRVTPSERPRLGKLARFELEGGRHFTTPLHIPMPLEPIERQIAARLDGTRTARELVPELARRAAQGDPVISVEGRPITDPALLEPMVEALVHRTLGRLARWGLAT
ncbi:MAG: class I SAM-dependent methyltransferase [Polyangiaceae bacterium]